jgi:hypothetical protein
MKNVTGVTTSHLQLRNTNRAFPGNDNPCLLQQPTFLKLTKMNQGLPSVPWTPFVSISKKYVHFRDVQFLHNKEYYASIRDLIWLNHVEISGMWNSVRNIEDRLEALERDTLRERDTNDAKPFDPIFKDDLLILVEELLCHMGQPV